MLGRSNRFHGNYGVRRVYRQGRPVRTKTATLHVLCNDKVRHTRVAVVVSRKVDKSAVKRNRIRRRVYEQVRAELPHIKQPTELVITAYSAELADISANKLKAVIDELFSKAKI